MSNPVVVPVSCPSVPPQPEQSVFDSGALALFGTFTRESYLAALGVQAPPFEPARAPQYWFDSSVDLSSDANLAVYRVVGTDASGTPVIRQMVVPAGEAARINLPGAFFLCSLLREPDPGHARRVGVGSGSFFNGIRGA